MVDTTSKERMRPVVRGIAAAAIVAPTTTLRWMLSVLRFISMMDSSSTAPAITSTTILSIPFAPRSPRPEVSSPPIRKKRVAEPDFPRRRMTKDTSSTATNKEDIYAA